MLKMMRHHAKYFYVLFFIVILTFIFWGVGTVDKDQSRSFVAQVGHHRITYEEYGRVYDRMFSFYRDLYRDKFDDEMQKKLNLKQNVLNSLIANRVLLIAADENGITVSDHELREAIMNEPSFMTNGSFDQRIYDNTLRLSRLTPATYETLKRQELTVMKMRSLIELQAKIADLPDPLAGADDQTMAALRKAISDDAREKLVNSFVEGYKKKLKITVNTQLIS